MKISVAMCTFNGSRFLAPQLESIAAQDRPPDELVVCDDGSSDGCEEIVREFSRRVAFPTRLLINDKRLGSTKNFQKAISLCEGEIVALADQDDVWYPPKLRRIANAFQSSPGMVAVFSDADLIDEQSNSLNTRLWRSFSFGPREQERFAAGHALNILVKHPVVTGATVAFRKKFINLLVPIPPNHIHDRWLSFLLAACGQFGTIAEPLMQYRRHEQQQVGPGILTQRAQFARAKNTGSDFYFEEIGRFQQLRERLEQYGTTFPYSALGNREISRKVSHQEHRARLPRKSVARIPRVLREVFNGGYWRYSEGWRSVAKDLVIR